MCRRVSVSERRPVDNGGGDSGLVADGSVGCVDTSTHMRASARRSVDMSTDSAGKVGDPGKHTKACTKL